ncbi:MAG: TetR/AcrR family transcriptional regulator [Lysinibacillus sp.]
MVKKQLIMENALQLFAEQGIEATSVQQITDKCGISKGAFYLSFKSKDELICALIDYFMSKIVEDIEQVVNSEHQHSLLLHAYYHQTFSTFEKHAHFARIFMKEHQTTFNVETFAKIEYYNGILNRLVHTIAVKQFDNVAEHMIPDVVFIIQSFARSYGELFFQDGVEIDLELLCQSLVEKVSLIAEHATIPFFSAEWLQAMTPAVVKLSKEELICFLSKKLEETDDSLIHESISLLRDHLTAPSLSPALEQGLLKNLRDNSHTKWIAYIYESCDKS